MRRAKRTDISALRLLAAPAAAESVSRTETRHWRRLASDPQLDFYVAEQAGAVQGMLLMCYVRSLGSPGWQALLDLIVRPLPQISLRPCSTSPRPALGNGAVNSCLCNPTEPTDDF